MRSKRRRRGTAMDASSMARSRVVLSRPSGTRCAPSRNLKVRTTTNKRERWRSSSQPWPEAPRARLRAMRSALCCRWSTRPGTSTPDPRARGGGRDAEVGEEARVARHHDGLADAMVVVPAAGSTHGGQAARGRGSIANSPVIPGGVHLQRVWGDRWWTAAALQRCTAPAHLRVAPDDARGQADRGPATPRSRLAGDDDAVLAPVSECPKSGGRAARRGKTMAP